MTTYVLGPNAARKLKGLFAGKGEIGRRDVSSNHVSFSADFADPFSVVWAQSANDGAGAWIIWLPLASNLLSFGNERIDPSSGLSAETNYPTGWFRIDDLDDDGGSVFLNIFEEDDKTHSASISSVRDSYAVMSVMIAEAVKGSDGDVHVKQLVTSSIAFSCGSSEEVAVDDKSVGKLDDGKLEIKGYNNLDNTETDLSFVQMIAPPYGTSVSAAETMERGKTTSGGVDSPAAVKYRKFGKLLPGANVDFIKSGNDIQLRLHYS